MKIEYWIYIWKDLFKKISILIYSHVAFDIYSIYLCKNNEANFILRIILRVIL